MRFPSRFRFGNSYFWNQGKKFMNLKFTQSKVKALLVVLVMLISPMLLLAKNGSGHHEGEKCASHAPDKAWEDNFQKMLLQTRKKMATQSVNQTYVIPVVVHVIHTGQAVGTAYNISAAQVQSQIDILNKDYAGIGLNVGNVPAVFKDLVANTGVSFCLATKKPDGSNMAEPGIDRIRASEKGWRNPGSVGYTTEYIDSVIKPQSYWDPSLYLNIWVTKLEEDLLGYATFPNFSTLDGLPGFWAEDARDGVVISYTAFGSGGVTTAPYNQGRTTTHEVGHWLGLRHIWGDDQTLSDNCSVDDFVEDTPLQSVSSSGCPNFPRLTCSNTGNMTMNFMDYSNDACMYMFTLGQMERMVTTFANSPNRIKLLSSPVCQTGALAPIAKFTSSKESICAGESVTFTDASLFTATSWKWIIPGGNPSSSTIKNPTVTFAAPGVYPVTLEATNGGGTSTVTIEFTVVPTLQVPYRQDFEGVDTTFPPYGWSLFTRNTKGVNWNPTSRASGFTVGKYCMYFDNTNLDVTDYNDDIRTPFLNLTGTVEPKLIFDVAHAPYTDAAYRDGLEVLVSLDCGVTFTSLYKKVGLALATAPAIGEDWEPKTTADWRRDTVDLKGYAGLPKVMIVIRNLAKYGHSTFIDNVDVRDYFIVTPPTVSNVTVSKGSICPGESVTYTAVVSNAPTEYVWTLEGVTPGTVTTTVPTLVVTYPNAGSFDVSVKVSNTGGSAELLKSDIVTVNSLPNVTVNSPSVCKGGSVTLNASGAASYSWSTSQTGASISVAPLVSSTYTVTGTSAAGCVATATSSVTVNNNPNVSVNSATVCAGTPVTLTATGATTYSWNTGEVLASIVVTPTVNSNYTVTGTDANGCKDTAVSTITISNEVPTITVNSPSICPGETVILTADGATTYSWDSGETTQAISVSPETTQSYIVTGSNGCLEGTATATVTVKSVPTITVEDVSGCVGEPITITASGADSYSWSNGASTNSIEFNISASEELTVTGTTDGCSTTETVAVTALTTPATPLITKVGDVLYSSSSEGNQWYLNGTPIEGATADSLVLTATGDYTVEVTNEETSCSALSAVSSVISLGIKNTIQEISAKLYPNPSKGEFLIEINSTISGNYALELINTTGQVIKSWTVDIAKGNQQIPVRLAGYANGVYYIRVIGAEGQLILPAMIQK